MSNFKPTPKTFAEVFELTRNSPAYYFSPQGLLLSVAENEPRLTSEGLLLEIGSTNHFLNCRDTNALGWVPLAGGGNAPTMTRNQVGVDGLVNTAMLLEDTGASVTQSVSQDVAVPDDTLDNMVSFFLRKTVGATVFPGFNLAYSGGSPSVSVVRIINTNTGESQLWDLSADNGDVLVESVGNWWRVTLVLPNNGGGHTSLRLQIWPACSEFDGALDATLQGSCVFDWAQCELGTDYASSPILSDDAVGYRPGERCTSPDLWQNIPSGQDLTIYGEFSDFPSEGGYVRYVALGNGSSANRVEITSGNAAGALELRGRCGGLAEFVDFPGLDFNAPMRYAIAIDHEARDIRASINGVLGRLSPAAFTGQAEPLFIRLNERLDLTGGQEPKRARHKSVDIELRAWGEQELHRYTNDE